MTYSVTIASSNGNSNTYPCAGASDQEALIFAGKVVEDKADRDDPDASVTIEKDGEKIGPAATVRDMVAKTI